MVRERVLSTLGTAVALPVGSTNAPVRMRESIIDGAAVMNEDEATAWDRTEAQFLTRRINNSECYSDGEACTNQAESYFSRLRRAELGIHHSIAGPYLNAYASEMAWRENMRREAWLSGETVVSR